MDSISNYQIPSNLFLITFKLLILEITANYSKKPSKHLKSTLLTLLLKMKFMQATMLTLFQKMLTLLQIMRLLKAILLTNQMLQMNPMVPTLVNSLAKRKSIQWIKGLLWASIMQDWVLRPNLC